MRSVSLTFLQSCFAQETGEAPVILVKIEHESLTTPIRVAGYDEDITSRGNLYAAYPFELSLPTDTENEASRTKIKIDNVDRQIVEAVRTASGAPPTVTIEVVLASTPDTVEAAFEGFELRNVAYDALAVEGELRLDTLAGNAYPAGEFRPGAFPGLF